MANTEGQDPNIRRLEREAERTRAELVDTVDELRSRVTDTVSPDHIKHDVKQYVSRTSQDVFENLKQKAKDNPLQAVAIGAGLAYPMWRMLRSVPVPVLLLGAGMALAGRSGQMGARRSANGSWSGNGSTSAGYGADYGAQRHFQSSARDNLGTGSQRPYPSADRLDEAYRDQFDSSMRHHPADGMQRWEGSQRYGGAQGARGQLSDMATRVSSAVSSGLSAVTSRVEHLFSGSNGAGGRTLSRNAGSTGGYSDFGTYGGSGSTTGGTGYRQRLEQNPLVEAAQRHRFLVGGGTLLLGAMLARSLTGRRGSHSRRTGFGRHRY